MKRFLVFLFVMFFIFIGAEQKALADEVGVREITTTVYPDSSVRITDTMGDRVIILRIRNQALCDADELSKVGAMLMASYLEAQSAQ